jgi:3D (Asp-Asp-Asp) domain-containing protein
MKRRRRQSDAHRTGGRCARGLRRHLPPAVRRYVPRWGSRRANRLVVAAAVAVLLLSLVTALLPDWPRTMVVTAYCPCTRCCGPNARGITASGKRVTANNGRFVAADRDLPFGTMLIIPGYNDGRPVEVLDRGGAIRGNRLDVFFPTHGEARQWGVRRLQVGRAAAAR